MNELEVRVKLTQKVFSVEQFWQEKDADKRSGTSDRSEAEKACDKNLGAPPHVERLDHKNWKDPEHPVASAIDDGRGQVHSQDNPVLPALVGGARRVCPPGGRRMALEYGHEEVTRSAYAHSNHDDT
jgi:hypothetical protein